MDKDENERPDATDNTSDPGSDNDETPGGDVKDASPPEDERDGTAEEPAAAADAEPTVGEAPAPVAATAVAVNGPADRPPGKREGRHRPRRITAAVLVVLTAVFALASVIGVWVHRSVYNESEFTAVVTPVASDSQVLDPLATYLTVQALEAIDLQGKIQGTLGVLASALPGDLGSRLGALSAPITSAAQGFVQQKVQEYLHSDAFRELFNKVVVSAHGKLVALIKGDYSQLPNLSVTGPTVTLNTIPIVAEILRRVAQGAADLVGLNVTIPEIPTGILPEQARQLLASALGVSLPPDFGQVPIMSSEQLHSYQSAAKLFDQLIVVLIVLAVVCFALAVILSMNRRRTLVQLGLAIAGALLLGGLVLRAVIRNVVNSLQSSGAKSAAHDVVNVMGQNLRAVGSVVLWVAVALAVVAYLAGRPRWAVRVVESTRRVSVQERGGTQLARFVAGRYDVLVAAASGVALILLAIFGVHWASVIVIGVLLAAVLWWLTALRAGERARTEPATA